MIQPTLGDRILFQVVPPAGAPAAALPPQPATGIVTYVHNDRLINTTVFDAHGGVHFQPSLQLLQDDDKPPAGGGYACWKPSQKDAAAEAADESSGPVSA